MQVIKNEAVTVSAGNDLTQIIDNTIVDDWDDDELLPKCCLLYTSPSPRDKRQSRMPSSA